MSRKHEQFRAQLQESVQSLLARGLNDPRISGLVTVTRVELAPDERNATVMVSVMPEDRQKATLAGLSAAAGHLRREIGRAITNRHIPQLVFRVDQTLRKQAEVFQALNRVQAERDQREEPGAGM